MRLIDADELIKQFHYGGIADTEEDKAWTATVRRTIKAQPTAYDIDKVVKQLDNSDVGTMFCSQCKYAKECETIADEMLEKYELNDRVDLCAMVMKTKAIEIVKKGGGTDE